MCQYSNIGDKTNNNKQYVVHVLFKKAVFSPVPAFHVLLPEKFNFYKLCD